VSVERPRTAQSPSGATALTATAKIRQLQEELSAANATIEKLRDDVRLQRVRSSALSTEVRALASSTSASSSVSGGPAGGGLSASQRSRASPMRGRPSGGVYSGSSTSTRTCARVCPRAHLTSTAAGVVQCLRLAAVCRTRRSRRSSP
jgi:hypothetical protein